MLYLYIPRKTLHGEVPIPNLSVMHAEGRPIHGDQREPLGKPIHIGWDPPTRLEATPESYDKTGSDKKNYESKLLLQLFVLAG